MNWFLRLKLAHKLLLSFLLCSLLTALVGGYSLTRLSQLGGTIHATYVENVLPLQSLMEAGARLSAHSRSYVRLPAMRDPAEQKETVKRAAGHLDKFQAALKAYRATQLSDTEQALMKQLDEQMPNYLAQNEKIAQLAQEGKLDLASDQSNGPARKAIADLEATLARVTEELASQTKATNKPPKRRCPRPGRSCWA